ncbi:unnamed protein product [Lathyrus sativus]|nr:unnamed protein product [Lathyrus sativus]
MASLALLRPCTFHHTHKPSTLTLKPKPNSLSFSPLTPPPSKLKLRNPVVKANLSSPAPPERLISIAAYALPFFNSLQYGHNILTQYPKFALLFEPIIPFLSFYRSLPYASFVAFFALYLGIVKNPSFPQFARFNAMQALTLDVLLVLPLLFQRIFSPGRYGLAFKVMVWSHNAVFIFSILCFVYSALSCLLGRTPYLPFVGDAAARQI